MCRPPPPSASSSPVGSGGHRRGHRRRRRRRDATSSVVAVTVLAATAAAIMLVISPITPSFASDDPPPSSLPLEPPEDLVRLADSLEEVVRGGGDGGLGLNASSSGVRRDDDDAAIEEEERRLRDAASAIRAKHAELLNRTVEVNRAVREHNRMELTDVLAGRLRDLLSSERRIREENSAYVAEARRRRREEEEEKATRRKEEARTRVRKSDLSEAFALSDDHFMVASEMRLEEFVANVAVDEIARRYQVADDEDVDVSHGAEEADKCVTNEGASAMVVSAIESYRGNATKKLDLAVPSSGASIVYARDMTSEAYVRPASHDDNLMRKISQWMGLRGPTRSAEEILSPSSDLGSCWPMRGRSGMVTIRLGRPSRVSSVSLRHASPSIEPPPGGRESSSGGGGGSSAPRFFRLVGYAGCRDGGDDDGCRVLGFDVASPIELGGFEYETVGRAQTFHIRDGEEEAREEEGEEDDEEAPEENDPFGEAPVNGCSWDSCGSASEEGGGVDATTKSDVELRALSLIVDDNWGNEDYTCIYHLGVHGEISVDEES